MDFRTYFKSMIKNFYERGYGKGYVAKDEPETIYPPFEGVITWINYKRQSKGCHPVKFTTLDEFLDRLDNEELYKVHDSQLAEYYR